MSMAELVRQRHALEDRVNRFLTQCDDCTSRVKTMDTRDIEICMAVLYDAMVAARDEETRMDRLFKGLLVKSVYDRRKSGENRRVLFWFITPAPTEIIQYKFAYPVPITETLANEWGKGGAQSVQKLLAP